MEDFYKPSSPALPPPAGEGSISADDVNSMGLKKFLLAGEESLNNYTPHFPAKLPEDIKAWAREMRAQMTDAEALLWRLLRNRRIAGAKFRRQHPVGRYILDYYCVENKLGIELDGGQHNNAADYDRRRDNWLESQGIVVLRFWNNQMLAETEAVMQAIYSAIIATDLPKPVGDNLSPIA